MQDKNLDGILPPNKRRSIRDIPIPPRKQNGNGDIKKTPSSPPLKPKARIRKPQTIKIEEVLEFKPINEPVEEQNEINHDHDLDMRRPVSNFDDEDFYQKPKSGKKTLVIIASIILLVILIIIPVLNFFARATIEINPKQKDIAGLNQIVPIVESENAVGGELAYKKLEIKETAEATKIAEQEEKVESSASGIITVYNEYSSAPQKLIQKTRFEAPDGKIYRIQESVSVPKGSIDVKVVADEPGEASNKTAGDTKFTIPGFKGQEQFEKIYAKQKTEISGGFSGVKKTVSENTINSEENNLKEQVKNQILGKIESQKTDGYAYLYSLDKISYEKPYQEERDGKVVIKLNASVDVFIVKSLELSSKVAEKNVAEYKGEPILLNNLSNLSLKLQNETIEGADGEGIPTNSIAISGDAKLVWQIDSDNLKKQIAGQKTADASQTLSKFVGIEEARPIVTPFWKTTFPEDIGKIEVKIKTN